MIFLLRFSMDELLILMCYVEFSKEQQSGKKTKITIKKINGKSWIPQRIINCM